MSNTETKIEPFQHNLLLGRGRDGDVWVGIRYHSDGTKDGAMRLSFTGVVGPKRNGDARGGCGQIVDHVIEDIDTYAEGWDRESVTELVALWRRWHLNDCRAGSPAQEEYVRANTHRFPGYPTSHYEWMKGELASAGLHPDPETGYRYGSAWLYEEIPADVLARVFAFPVATKDCPWGTA